MFHLHRQVDEVLQGMGCVVYLYLTGFWKAGGGANGRRVTGSGRVVAQQVVEGGRCDCGWDHCSVIGGCLLFLSSCSSGFQDSGNHCYTNTVSQNPVRYKYTTHPIPCHTSSTCL